MKKILIFLFVLFRFVESHASPQAPDYLIINNDTIAIYTLPLYNLPEYEVQSFYNIVKEYEGGDIPVSFSLWRGYNLLWELSNEKLYLVSIIGNKNSDIILQKSFPQKYKDGKVLADWYNGQFTIPAGELLRWDGIFSRTYLKEDIMEFQEGNVSRRLQVDNYIHLPNAISRINKENPYEGYPKTVTDTIFQEIKKLDWSKLSEINDCGCDDKYIIEINENGIIDKVEYVSWISDNEEEKLTNDINNHKDCIDVFLNQLKKLQFDIIRWNGHPYRERVLLKLFYSEEEGLENWSE